MRNIFRKTILAIAIACVCGSTAEAAKNTSKANENDGKITFLTKEVFDKQICNTNNNDWKYLGNKPCVIDFFATWCGPCKMLSPRLEKMAAKYKGQMNVYKVDVDQERALAQKFGASSIPLLIFIPMEGAPTSQRGLMSEEDLEEAIRTAVLGLPKSK